MSYIEDVEEADGICRVYGYSDASLEAKSLANGRYDWVTKTAWDRCLMMTISLTPSTHGTEMDTFGAKGKACRQSKEQFD